MYIEEILDRYLDTRRYEAAKTLVKEEKIIELENDMFVSESKPHLQIIAEVQGSEIYPYKLEVVIDIEKEKVTSAKCDCMDFNKNRRMCKHMGAALIKYMNELTILDVPQRSYSTWDFLEILKGYEKDSVLVELNTMDNKRQVTIEPTIIDDVGMKELTVSFKIGRDKKYLVKDVVKFLEDIEDKRTVRYGKDLEFTHNIEVFDEIAKEWIKVMKTWKENVLRVNNQSRYRSYIGSHKEINVFGESMDRVIEICGKEGIIPWKNPKDKKPTNYMIVEGAPRYQVSITRGEQEATIRYLCPEFHIGEEYLLFSYDNKKYYDKRENWKSVESFLLYLATKAPEEFYLSENDYSLFSEELLPHLQEKFDVELVDFMPYKYTKDKPQFHFTLIQQRDLGEVICNVDVIYEDRTYTMLADKNDISHRNLKEELKVERIMSKLFTSNQNGCYWMQDTDDNILHLLRNGLEQLSKIGQVQIDENLLKAKSKFKPSVELGVAVKGNLLDITLSSDDLSFKEIQEILSKYSPKKNYYKLKSGEFIDLTEGTMESLIKINSYNKMDISKANSGHVSLPTYRALYFDEVLIEHREHIESVRDKGFRHLINNIKTVEDSDYQVPTSIMVTLRAYQEQGFKWLKTMKSNGFGCILADDMGLGKTLQAITFLQSEKEEYPDEIRDTLVVCPASLIYNWESEIKKFAPNLSVEVVVGNQEDRLDIISKEGLGRILVTSYDLLRRDIEAYKEKEFVTQIIDEAQYIKNHNTQMTKAVKLIQSDFTVAMTGTPVENRLSELWSIFDYLMPGFLYNYNQFRKEIELPVVQNDSKEAMTRLQRMVHPFILRRTKGEVLKDLPDKVEKVSATKMSGEQKKLYDAHALRLKKILEKQSEEEFKQGKIEVLAELTKLRQLCCHPSLLYGDYTEESAKLELCMEYVRQAVEGGHKILLFSQFTSMLDIITEKLKAENISFYKLTGSTSKEKRRDLVDAFNKDDTSVFCISLKAGGTGLNLTSADMVIHFDPWWNAAAENQATDRAHRMGQKNTVNVYKLVMEGTIEEKIVNLQSKKLELANQILSGENISTGAFTKGELLDILEV